MRNTIAILSLGGALLVLTAASAPQTWSVDPVHSSAQFTARHFGIVPVIGTIPIKNATVKLSEGSQIPVAVSASLDPTQLDTHDSRRDDDLRSPHFFDVATQPAMTFASTNITASDPKHFTIEGNLTMHGQTHPVTLIAEVVASGKSPRGRDIIAYAATATIDRTQWGMTYGPMIVSNNVDISLNIEADGP
jgi:polyisoprenoid-binding protein YceI